MVYVSVGVSHRNFSQMQFATDFLLPHFKPKFSYHGERNCFIKILVSLFFFDMPESECICVARNSKGVETCNSRSMFVNIHFYHIWKP